jgi:hypothetical protein
MSTRDFLIALLPGVIAAIVVVVLRARRGEPWGEDPWWR